MVMDAVNVITKNVTLLQQRTSPDKEEHDGCHSGSTDDAADRHCDDEEEDCKRCFGRLLSEVSARSETSTIDLASEQDGMTISKTSSWKCSALPDTPVMNVTEKNTFLDVVETETQNEMHVRDPRKLKTAPAKDHSKEMLSALDALDLEDDCLMGHTSSENSSMISFRGTHSGAQGDTEQAGDSGGEADQQNAASRRNSKEMSAKPITSKGMPEERAPVPNPLLATVAYNWTIDAKKLRGNDRSVVSRPFDLSIGGVSVPFKMMLYAKAFSGDMGGRGGQSFKMARGQGSLQLKCEHDLGEAQTGHVPLRFSIGKAAEERVMKHDFSQSAACSSPDWDFSKAVDPVAQTFVVSVEILP